jgi:hypothetical protein
LPTEAFISRIVALTPSSTGLGIEIVIDNPTQSTVWIDQIQLIGAAQQYIRFSLNVPFFHGLTYKISMKCDLAVLESQRASYKLDSSVQEHGESDWSYPATGEFIHEFPGGPGKTWYYSITFPVLLSIPGEGRSALRLLFSAAQKFVMRDEHQGTGPNGMFTSHTSTSCKVRAVKNTGEAIESEMDDAFLRFLANEGSITKEPQRSAPVPSLSKTVPISVVFLSSDPTDAARLRLGTELREIQEKLQLARLRDQITLHQRMAVRVPDLSQCLLDVSPKIVHFSGHGASDGALCLEGDDGRVHPVSPDALASLFEQFSDCVECALLNACYSLTQAEAIASHIPFVIGMSSAISDQAAIAFSVGFYQAIGAGRTIEQAFKLGVVQIRLQGVPEHLTPTMLSKHT